MLDQDRQGFRRLQPAAGSPRRVVLGLSACRVAIVTLAVLGSAGPATATPITKASLVRGPEPPLVQLIPDVPPVSIDSPALARRLSLAGNENAGGPEPLGTSIGANQQDLIRLMARLNPFPDFTLAAGDAVMVAANYVSTFRLLLLGEFRDRYREFGAEDRVEIVASLLELQVQQSMGMTLDDGASALRDVGTGTSIRGIGTAQNNWLSGIAAFFSDFAEAVRVNLGIEKTEGQTAIRPRTR